MAWAEGITPSLIYKESHDRVCGDPLGKRISRTDAQKDAMVEKKR